MSISAPLRSALAVRRHELNRTVAEVRAAYPGLDGDDVLAFLSDTVAPIADAVHAIAPDAVVGTVEAFCAVGLPLVAQGWLGPHARNPKFVAGVVGLSTALPSALAENPARFAGSVINALYHLTRTPGVRVDEWGALVCRVAGRADLRTMLLVGQVAAWRCGMAHLREGALDLLPQLPADLAASVLGASGALTDRDLARLRADPWLLPEKLGVPPSSTRLTPVGRVGGFAGFGGAFRRPPQVHNLAGYLHAQDGLQQYRVHADAFGAVLRPAVASASTRTGSVRIDRHGKVRFLDGLAELPVSLRCTSCADDGVTLAMTSESSHWIWLFAKVPV